MGEERGVRWLETLHTQTDLFASRLERVGEPGCEGSGEHDLGLPILDGFEAAIEELRVAEEELRQQSDELALSQGRVEVERQRYQELFDLAPDAYFVTDAIGTIQEANRAAVGLLGLRRIFITGKPLAAFVARDQYQAFRTKLLRLQDADYDPRRDWEVRIRTRSGKLLDAAIRVAAIRDESGQVTSLRWLVRDNTARREAEQEAKRLTAELERRVRERTAQLAAVATVNQAVVLQEQEARAAIEVALRRQSEALPPICQNLEASLTGLQELARRLRQDVAGLGVPEPESVTADLAQIESMTAAALADVGEIRAVCRREGDPNGSAQGVGA